MKFIKNYQFNLVRKSQKIVLGLFLIVLMLGLFEALILSPEDYLQGDSCLLYTSPSPRDP